MSLPTENQAFQDQYVDNQRAGDMPSSLGGSPTSQQAVGSLAVHVMAAQATMAVEAPLSGVGGRMKSATEALPIVKSAAGKLEAFAQKFGMSADDLLKHGMQGGRFVDKANKGNINILSARPDGKAEGMFRVTLDPEGQRVISAGIMKTKDVTKAVENGRLQELGASTCRGSRVGNAGSGSIC